MERPGRISTCAEKLLEDIEHEHREAKRHFLSMALWGFAVMVAQGLLTLGAMQAVIPQPLPRTAVLTVLLHTAAVWICHGVLRHHPTLEELRKGEFRPVPFWLKALAALATAGVMVFPVWWSVQGNLVAVCFAPIEALALWAAAKMVAEGRNRLEPDADLARRTQSLGKSIQGAPEDPQVVIEEMEQIRQTLAALESQPEASGEKQQWKVGFIAHFKRWLYLLRRFFPPSVLHDKGEQ